MSTHTIQHRKQVSGLIELLPDQGEWPEQFYLALPNNRRVEYTDGYIEILPMPTTSHQLILLFLLELILAASRTTHPGKALMAGIKLRIRKEKYREPDIIFVRSANANFVSEDFWTGADLVVEIVSPKNRKRDLVEKRIDYAEGRVPEYWIVDPQQQTFTVLTLQNDTYVEHGVFRPDEKATSMLLTGVSVDIAACFAAGAVKS